MADLVTPCEDPALFTAEGGRRVSTTDWQCDLQKGLEDTEDSFQPLVSPSVRWGQGGLVTNPQGLSLFQACHYEAHL